MLSSALPSAQPELTPARLLALFAQIHALGRDDAVEGAAKAEPVGTQEVIQQVHQPG